MDNSNNAQGHSHGWRAMLGRALYIIYPGGAMLVLDLEIGDEIRIGDDILITIMPFHKYFLWGARLGLDVPRDIPIVREELVRKPLPRLSGLV